MKNFQTRLWIAFNAFLFQAVLWQCCGIPVDAQSRQLPRAGFGSYEGALPPVDGMHLTPGLSHPKSSPAQVYNPGEPTLNQALVRWQKEKMPLLIWISPGLKLPDCPFDAIPATRVDQVFQMLHEASPFRGLMVARGWTPETNDTVALGIEEWRRFEEEGLISFGFTDDPTKAHILIFFTDSFQGASSPGGISVGGITSAQIYPIQQANSMKIAQKPVVIELSLDVNSTEDRLRGASAHEFGHALGIKSHSPYRDDLMYVDRVVTDLSPSDVATFRALYRTAPQYVM